jgi:hypothetical protein
MIKDFSGAFFFSKEGLVLEAKVDETCLLKRKDISYISIKGNDSANYYLLSSVADP